MKRIRLILIGLVLVVLLSVGLIGGITLAQTTGTTGDSGNTLIARVATILGIDEAKVEAAFNQAQHSASAAAPENARILINAAATGASRLRTLVRPPGNAHPWLKPASCEQRWSHHHRRCTRDSIRIQPRGTWRVGQGSSSHRPEHP